MLDNCLARLVISISHLCVSCNNKVIFIISIIIIVVVIIITIISAPELALRNVINSQDLK